jgi:hypothetical protein
MTSTARQGLVWVGFDVHKMSTSAAVACPGTGTTEVANLMADDASVRKFFSHRWRASAPGGYLPRCACQWPQGAVAPIGGSSQPALGSTCTATRVPSGSVSTRGGLLLLLGLPNGDRGESGPRQGARKTLVT